MRKNKIVSGLLVTALFVPVLGRFDLPVRAEETEEKKAYIIVAENDAVYETVSEIVNDKNGVEAEVLSDNNIMLAELTEDEVEILDEDDMIMVEEDIIISGSTLEDYENNSKEIVYEEARKKKEELKQLKREQLAAMDFEEQMPETKSDLKYEWNIQAVNADEVIENSEESTHKIKVAVLDSGVDYSEGINQKGYVNFVDEGEEFSPIFQDESGHGTGIASIISGNGETGIYGVSPDVDLYSVKVLDGENKAPLSRIIRGIYWCIENDVDIINMSFGTPDYSKTFEQAVEDAYQAGLLMVAAAGNEGDNVEYPAAFPEVMAVASVNSKAKISEFCNVGEELDIAAPGEKVRVAGFFDGNVVTHGTSIAVPHVTGTAALLWSKDRSKSNEFIRQLINYSAKDIEGMNDCGLLDAAYALKIYNEFAECFEENPVVLDEKIEGNSQMPEDFEHTTESEAYVEGKWTDSVHAALVPNSVSGFSAEEITIIKAGIRYPDKKASWKNSVDRPWWHGKWEHKDPHNLGRYDGRQINYAAVLEMLSEIALAGGKIPQDMTHGYIFGLDNKTFDRLKSDINNMSNTEFAANLTSDTAKNRKYFLFGCALHPITDAFAHSTAELDGSRINHDAADYVSHRERRHKMATYITKICLKNLKNNIYCDGEEVIEAVKSQYEEGLMKFKIIKLKLFIENNGYYDPILSKMDCSNPRY